MRGGIRGNIPRVSFSRPRLSSNKASSSSTRGEDALPSGTNDRIVSFRRRRERGHRAEADPGEADTRDGRHGDRVRPHLEIQQIRLSDSHENHARTGRRRGGAEREREGASRARPSRAGDVRRSTSRLTRGTATPVLPRSRTRRVQADRERRRRSRTRTSPNVRRPV